MAAHRLLCANSWKHSILPLGTRRRGGWTLATRSIEPPQYDGGWITRTAQRFQSGRGDDNGGESCATTTTTVKEPLASIFHPPDYTMIQDDDDDNNKIVANSIRWCLHGYGSEDPKHYSQDTGMHVRFLGTSAGIPTQDRSTSATVLRVGSSHYMLFDAGEGVQRQLLFSKVNTRDIRRIFITHLHGDHLFGLPGLLLGLNNFIKKENQPDVVKVYGPPGLYNYIAANLVLSCSNIQAMTIEIYELLGGQTKRGTRQGERNPFYQSFPEFHHPMLKRRFLSPDANGIWTIDDVPTRSREEILNEPKHILRMDHRRISIKAAEVQHVPGVVTFGFAVEEEEPPRNIDPKRALALGVDHKSKKYDLLKLGFSVQSDDGSREVKPEEVLVPKKKRARKFVLVGDNQGWSPAMMSIAQNTDILVHEATLFDEDQERGHSTAGMAGRVAGKVNAGLLVLHHISAKTINAEEKGRQTVMDQIGQARIGVQKSINDSNTQKGGNTRVLAAYDFMEIVVPWMGFGDGATSHHIQEEKSTNVRKHDDGMSESSPKPQAVAHRVSQWFV